MPKLKKPMRFNVAVVSGACSTGNIYAFDTPYNSPITLIPSSKSGKHFASFTTHENSKKMYEALKEIMDIEYQSEPVPGNDGMPVFICIF